MKICLLSRFFDFRNAGLGRVGFEIRDELIRRGHDVTCVSTEGKSLVSYFKYTAIDIRKQMPTDADVYHAITPMEAMWLPREKSIVTFHDLFQITDPDKLGSGLNQSPITRTIGCEYFRFAVNRAKLCKKLTAVSSKTQADVARYLHIPQESITVIRSGIRPDLDETEHERFAEPTIGYIGQLDRRKRVDILIRALAKSTRTYKALIAGTGAERQTLETLAQGDKRISFLGYVDDADLVNFYNTLDVLVFPTYIEGYGLPIVEAMACKKPVIVLADAVLPPEIRQRCIVLPTIDQYVAWDTDWTRFVDIEDNYKWAKAHTWTTAVDQYEELYWQFVDETHR